MSIKQMTAHAGRLWGNEITHPLLVGIKTGMATLESIVVIPWEAGNGSTSISGCITLGHIPNHTDPCSSIFISALFIIARN